MTIPSSATPIVRQAAGGFTLFEVLISVLLLAVGLMAAAIMQLNAARSTQQSNFQSIALGLATQVAEEIRQNSTEANKPAPNAFLPMIYAATSAPSSISGNCYAVQCTSADLARMNRHEWQATLGDRLGKGARLEVCRDASVAGANGNYQWCNAATPADAFAPIAVKVGWMDKTTDADSVSVAPPKVVVLVSPTTQ